MSCHRRRRKPYKYLPKLIEQDPTGLLQLGKLYVTKNRTYFKVLAKAEDSVTVQTVNVDDRSDFVEEVFSIPERELIKMSGTIWEIK